MNELAPSPASRSTQARAIIQIRYTPLNADAVSFDCGSPAAASVESDFVGV